MRRLYDRELAVSEKPADRHLQKGTSRHVIRVEDRNQVAIRVLQCVIEVSGFGMKIVIARYVPTARFIRELTEFLTPAIVQEPDAQLVLGIVDAQRTQDRDSHYRQRFIVSGYIEINRWPDRGVLGKWLRLALQRPRGLQIP